MLDAKCPSYLPTHFPQIPAGLIEEQDHWGLNPEHILEDSTAREFLKSHQMGEKHLRGILLDKGYNPDIQNKGRLVGHNTRVSLLSLLIKDGLERSGSPLKVDTRILAGASIWHDVGKYKQEIHDAIFPSTKRIPKGDPAWKTIRTHPEVGKDIPLEMKDYAQNERVKISEAIHYHHERMDGDGYHQKMISEVPPESFVISVADTIDVMLGRRAYANHPGVPGTLAELRDHSGTQFHPEVVKVAVKALLSNNGELIIHKRHYLH